MTSGLRRPTENSSPPLEYVIPLCWEQHDTDEFEEFTAYLESLTRTVDVTVVDGSPAGVFAAHAQRWAPAVRHLPPQPWPGRNGKVGGVVTGVRAARHEAVVIADDDVRYTAAQLGELAGELAGADLVRPQNFFRPAPWHARWDTARSLINRAVGGDYPGTFLLRRSTFLAMGGYHGDVLFENLQLIRTVRAAGGRERRLPGFYVARRPPSASRFREQRVRQAYDDFAQPGRLIAEAGMLPLALVAAVRKPGLLLAAAGVVVAVAEYGRRRAGGAAVFHRSAALWAPLWAAERAVCVWPAIVARIRGGVRYRGQRLRHAALPVDLPRRPVGGLARCGPADDD